MDESFTSLLLITQLFVLKSAGTLFVEPIMEINNYSKTSFHPMGVLLMNHRSKELIDLTKQFLELSFPNETFVSIDGSTARGTADQYSDIDLTIYGDLKQQYDKNIEFFGVIVQVHFATLPQLVQIHQDPWAFRFLTEMKIIKDRNDYLKTVKREAIEFFNSLDGKQRMLKCVKNIISDRIVAANRFYKVSRFYSATNAAMGAWSEAAFLHIYFTEGNLSTSHVIPCIREDDQLYRSFREHSSIRECSDINDFSPILHKLRAHLRKRNVDASFDLDPLQEKLVEHKNQRFIQNGNLINLQWQMYGEALWLYFCIDEQTTFEQFYEGLSTELKQGLSLIGFIPLEKQHIDGLCNLSIRMIKTFD
jgi:predicted nucleotidyltransferase